MDRSKCWLCGELPLTPGLAKPCSTTLSLMNNTVAQFVVQHELKTAVETSGEEIVCDICLGFVKRLAQTWSEYESYRAGLQERIDESATGTNTNHDLPIFLFFE